MSIKIFSSDNLDEITVRRLFIFMKENLIFESIQDELLQKKILNEREIDECNNRNRHFKTETLIKIIIRKRRCKEFIDFIHELHSEEHVSKTILQFQTEYSEQKEQIQTVSNGNVK